MNKEFPNQNQPNKEENEIDILALFEYFKQGIKSFFNGIKGLFISIIHLLIEYLLLLKKHIILVFIVCIAFVLFGFFKSSLLGEKYKYQMIVKPQLNSVFALKEEISAMNTEIENNTQPKVLKGITKVKITPIKIVDDEVRRYYDITKNYTNQKDSIFYQSVTLDEFKNQIKDEEYSLQNISVYSNTPINTDSISNLFINPIIKDTFWSKELKDKIHRLTVQENNTLEAIKRIDSLLYSYQQKENIAGKASININGESGKTNVEQDLLNQSLSFSAKLEEIQEQISESRSLISIISNLKRVENDSIRSYVNPISGILLGIITSTFIILLVELYKYLGKIEQKRKSKNG